MARIRVLVVEDDAIIAKGIRHKLQNMGFSVLAVESYGEKAVESAEKLLPDLVLMDIVLKGDMDGVEAAERIRSRFEIPVVYLTAYADDATLKRARITGPGGYILKPFKDRELQIAVDIALYRHEQERKLKKAKDELEARVAERTAELRTANEQLQAELAERRAVEEKMRLIIEASPIGIAISHNGIYAYLNPACVTLFGYDAPEEILGLPVEMLCAPKGGRRAESGQNTAENRPLQYEAVGKKKDGKPFEISVWVTQIDYRGEPSDLAFLIDVSSEKALRAQLLQAQKLEALGTLAGGIAHDFNNILGIILAHGEVALLKTPRETPLYKNLEQLRKAGHRGKDLVKQILAFSRRSEEEQKPLQLDELVREALSMMRAVIPSTIEICREIETLPGEDALVASPAQIHQVLMNLCGNAAYAMREKGGVLKVRLFHIDFSPDDVPCRPSGLEAGAYLALEVSDTGQGMDSALMERVFEPYFTTKGPGEGSGLGLAVVHGIVTSHRGAITVSSESGVGTTFTVYLPSSYA